VSDVNTPGINWSDLFAERTRYMKRSAIRELLRHTGRPGMISFAGGLPAPELFPVDEMREASAAVLKEHPASALQYGETEGIAGLRDWVVNRFSESGLRLSRANVLIVSGAQQGLDLLGRVLLNQGDAVAVDNPTYLALLSAWRPLEPRFVAGIDSATAKVIYTVPNFQNPNGTTLDLNQRNKVIAHARANGSAIIEDDPYRELLYEGELPPSLLTLDGGQNVVYVSTFSKVLAPGLRVGWVIGHEALIEKLVQAKQGMDLHTSTFNQLLVLELLRRGIYEGQIPRLRETYRRRRDAMLQALEKHFPAEAKWTRPAGGMFLMVHLPPSLSAAELLTRCLEKNVAFVPGEEFHLRGEGKNTLRLNFSNATPERITEGIRRIASLL
jgi:2-aminoadipate transaminase